MLLQRSLMTVSKFPKSFDKNQKTVLSSSRNKQSDSNHGQQEMSRGRQSRRADLSCDDVDPTEYTW